ncbi:hypothetical protein CERSUDRAFT_101221 [Gelatoporia subvermispora B]|uniref:Uncharacterized protein n=1 Tax=Ceriporiopsis subvermispora (strain B) TaxID=914234 RepID=M2QVM3_CERS8|nr:hypothetical protein CERSUDRAFT_101221 [Gelatoporia subvermispora B]
MGRKLKYIDKEARKAARAAQKRRYNESERSSPFNTTQIATDFLHHRGREARKVQNRRAYIVRQAKTRSPFAQWTPSHLPSSLLDLARQPFVVTEWDGLEDLSLGLWNVPYEVRLPAIHIRMWQCSAEHINFHQWGLILDRGNERRDRAEHSEEGFAALVAQIDQERGDRLRQWMKDFKRLASVTLDEELWRTGLGWSARILAVIESEAEVCRLGQKEYLKAFDEHKLAWQNLNWLRDVNVS